MSTVTCWIEMDPNRDPYGRCRPKVGRMRTTKPDNGNGWVKLNIALPDGYFEALAHYIEIDDDVELDVMVDGEDAS